MVSDGRWWCIFLKMYEDVNGSPGAEFYSQVIAGGLSQGWNTRDLSSETLLYQEIF